MIEMGIKAIIVFIFAVILVRISGRRSLGVHTPFDMIFNILLGAILSRVVVGASPILPTMIACLILALMHRLFGLLALFFPVMGRFIKGSDLLIYDHKKFMKKNMIRALVSKKDILEQLHLKTQGDSLDGIEKIFMERSGEMSFIKKKD